MFRSRVRLAPLLLGVLAALAVAPAPASALGALWEFPGGCRSGLDVTLQACINDAGPGDGILIVSDAPIGEAIVIGKSLTMSAGNGHHPTITMGMTVSATSGALSVGVSGIRFGAPVVINLTGGAGHTVTLDHLAIAVTGNDSLPGPAALQVTAGVPASVSLTSSKVSNTGDFGLGVALEGQNTSGLVSFRLVGDRITAQGSTLSYDGVNACACGDGGSVDVQLYNDVISGMGCPHCLVRGKHPLSAIALATSGTSRGTFDVVGDTLDGIGFMGLSAADSVQPGGSFRLDAFDDVFSHVAGAAVYLDSRDSSSPATLALSAGYDDFKAIGLANRLEGRSLGSHDMHVAPGFEDAAHGDLRLAAGSQLIDKGVVCSLGGVADPDASGHGRLAGASVDIGAYERGASGPNGVAVVGGPGPDILTGTAGADILCGMGGVDVAEGAAGADYIDGGPGADTLTGGGGPDRLFGRGGNDELCAHDGMSGNDRLDGGTGNDGYRADPGDHKSAVEHPAAC